MRTRGEIQLGEALRPKVMSQSDLAKELGVSPQAVSGWVIGRAKPTPDLMARIEDLLGIPMRAWTETEDESGHKGAAE